MAKAIAYIEIDTHAEIAGNFKKIISASEEFQVDYYFSAKILKQLDLKYSSNVFCVTAENIFSVLKTQSLQKRYDCVIIGTVHRYFKTFLEITRSFPTGIIVHNRNFLLLSKRQLLANIFKTETIFRLKLLLKENLLKKDETYEAAKYHFFLEEGKSNAAQKDVFLPLYYADVQKNAQYSSETIVIPGSVSQQRRDYRNVLSKLESWRDTFDQKNIQRSGSGAQSERTVVFLGKASGAELKWLQDFEQEKRSAVKIIYFAEKVPENIFADWMQKATYLWCPLQKETEFFSNTEIYGESKISGIIGDAIRYQKIAFLPAFYKSTLPFIKADPGDLEGQLELYKSFETEDHFQQYQLINAALKLSNVLKDLI